MRRALVPGAVVALLLALPLAGRAAPAPAITLTSPTSGNVAAGDLSVTWSYRGFSRAAFVDVEAARDGEPFTRLARVSIDDGTPGFRGSYTWSTAPEDDGDDWTVRVVAPSNKWVSSSVSPIVVDNTAPEATEAGRSPAANDAGWNNSDVTVTWACTDATSGVVEPEVSAIVTGEGEDLSASAVCTDLAGNSATAAAQGVNIDRTMPTVQFHVQPSNGMPALALLDITGEAEDDLSGVAGVSVVFIDSAGTETRRAAWCHTCGPNGTEWFVSTTGLAPGQYTVSAASIDRAGNVGDPAAVDFVIVSAPEVSPITVSEETETLPDVAVPEEPPSEGTVIGLLPPVPDVGSLL